RHDRAVAVAREHLADVLTLLAQNPVRLAIDPADAEDLARGQAAVAAGDDAAVVRHGPGYDPGRAFVQERERHPALAVLLGPVERLGRPDPALVVHPDQVKAILGEAGRLSAPVRRWGRNVVEVVERVPLVPAERAGHPAGSQERPRVLGVRLK